MVSEAPSQDALADSRALRQPMRDVAVLCQETGTGKLNKYKRKLKKYLQKNKELQNDLNTV